MNPEARAKMALVALIVVLAAMATLSAAPASAGQSWEQSPDCDRRIAVWRRLPLVNTRHRMEFGGYARDVGAAGRSPLLEIAFPGGVGSEIPTHAGRRWILPPAGFVKSRWDWAAMGRHMSLQAFPPTQIAPTGYISYTIRPEDIVPPEKVLANPYYREKINSTYWLPPFRAYERQKAIDECIFRATVFGIMAKNNPEIAAITDPYQQALKILEVAAVDPNLASMMPKFRGATGMSVEEAGQWRQRVVNWLKENQTKNPASFRGWVNWFLEGAKVHSGVVIQVPTPTPERPTPSAEAPELSEWGLKWDAGRKVYVTVDNRYGLPAGSEAGIYAKEKYFVNGEERWGWIGLKAAVIEKLQEQYRQRREFKIPLMLDPRGMVVEIEEHPHPYDSTLRFVGIKGLKAGTFFRAPRTGIFIFYRAYGPLDGDFAQAARVDNPTEGISYQFLLHKIDVQIPGLEEGKNKEVLVGEAIFKLGDEKPVSDWFPGAPQVVIESADLLQEKFVGFDLDGILDGGGSLVFPLP